MNSLKRKTLENQGFLDSLSGVGGIRTLVQTGNYTAFYTLSFCLGFREIAGQKPPTHSLFSINLESTSRTCTILVYVYETQNSNAINQGF